MKWIFWLALWLRLPHKFWGDWYLKWHRKRIRWLIDNIDLDISDIKFKE